MTNYNIIGDIAGQYATLVALLEKMPKDAVPLSVGDMVDRGPDSKKVVQFFMDNGEAILGNHEHMCLDYSLGRREYMYGTWSQNGGQATLTSYGGVVDPDHLTWLDELPLCRHLEGAFVSHAFLGPTPLDKAKRSLVGGGSIIWSRYQPIERKDLGLQIAGHNSHFGYKWFSSSKAKNYAVCLDSSRQQVLTGIHYPSLEVFQQEYI